MDFVKIIKFGLIIIASVVGISIALIGLPALPIIIYLGVLFSVIKLLWEKIKKL